VTWEYQTISPDILGFASSLKRPSKYTKLPDMDSTIRGAERARKLREVKVMMQNVNPEGPVEKFNLRTLSESASRLMIEA